MSHVKPRIEIVTKDGRKHVKTQWANAQWGVHLTYLRHGHFATRCWTLTHRASGQAIVKHIDWRDARMILHELQLIVDKYGGLFTEKMCGCEQERLGVKVTPPVRWRHR
jgi:hypothetical protein